MTSWILPLLYSHHSLPLTAEVPAAMRRILTDYRRFFNEFRRDFHHTGALLPSGGVLARTMAKLIRGNRPPARILEVGPGTGAITRGLAGALQPGDQLDAVEINPRFAQLLEERFASDPAFERARHSVRVINAAVQDLPGESVYDYIVSGLPLNNFSPDDIRSIFTTLQRLSKPGAILSYFEYTFIRTLKRPFAGAKERQRLGRISAVLKEYIRTCQVRREHVLLNLPPATVRQLCLKPATCDPAGDAVSC